MAEILLPIGSIIKVRPDDEDEPRAWMIVGRRAINPNTGKAWDYVSVPHPEGYVQIKSNPPNFYYCNHPEIDEIVMKAQEPDDYQVNCSHKNCPICNGA
jgi:hypothetical protein